MHVLQSTKFLSRGFESNQSGIFGTFSEYMNFKNNDLYKFKQSTKDLKHANSSHISALKNFLQSDVRQWLQNVTGIELNQEIDLFCAKYRYVINQNSVYIFDKFGQIISLKWFIYYYKLFTHE